MSQRAAAGTHAGACAGAYLDGLRAEALGALLRSLIRPLTAPKPPPAPPAVKFPLPRLVGKRMPALHEVPLPSPPNTRTHSLALACAGAHLPVAPGRAAGDSRALHGCHRGIQRRHGSGCATVVETNEGVSPRALFPAREAVRTRVGAHAYVCEGEGGRGTNTREAAMYQ